MTESSATHSASPPSAALVAGAGWLLPGAGYWLLGQRSRALVIGVTVFILFMLGILFAGVRVIDVPGYDRLGQEVRLDVGGRRFESTSPEHGSYESGRWALTGRGFFGEITNKPWYVAQFMTGPISLIASRVSLGAARSGIPVSHARLFDIGTLYTAVAGMLNLLAIIDASHRAAADEQKSEAA